MASGVLWEGMLRDTSERDTIEALNQLDDRDNDTLCAEFLILAGATCLLYYYYLMADLDW